MKLSRRDFLKVAGFGVAGAAPAPTLPGTGLAPAAQGPTFPAPTGIGTCTSPGVVEVALQAEEGWVPVAGRSARLWTYNGRYPGPTLKLREGDHVRLEFTNRLREATNLHFHGLHIPPTGLGDNVFFQVAPGETAHYEFTVPEGSAGTYWYHPHVHEATARQLFRGLAGAIVVEGTADAALHGLSEQLLIVKDIEFRADGTVPAHNREDQVMGREGSLVTVNGAERPTLDVPDGMVRLRLLNASNARYYRLRLSGATMHVVATDGNLVAAPYRVNELLLVPSERYDVVAQFPHAGRFELTLLPYDRAPEEEMEVGGMAMGSTAASPGGAALSPLMHFEVASGSTYSLPTTLTSITPLKPGEAVRKRRIVLNEDMEKLEFYIDDKMFDPTRTDFRPKLGTVEHWELVNESGMDHPMHLHVHPFQVYAHGGIPEPRASWKDVVNVPAKGRVELLVPFADFVGKTVMHCHIVEHEDFGMMSVVDVA